MYVCALVVTSSTTEAGCYNCLKVSFLGAPMALFIVVLVVVALVLCFCTALLKWNEVRYRRKGLPQGTMGWPVFGETTEFLKQGPNFMKNKRAR